MYRRFGFVRIEDGAFSGLKEACRIQMPEQMYKRGGQPGPAGLVTSADARSIVAMEVLVEQNTIAPVRIFLKLLCAPENRPAARFIAEENAGEPPAHFSRYFKQVHHLPRTGRTLDFEGVSVIQIEVQQRPN